MDSVEQTQRLCLEEEIDCRVDVSPFSGVSTMTGRRSHKKNLPQIIDLYVELLDRLSHFFLIRRMSYFGSVRRLVSSVETHDELPLSFHSDWFEPLLKLLLITKASPSEVS